MKNPSEYYYFNGKRFAITPFQNQVSISFGSRLDLNKGASMLQKLYPDIKWHFFPPENVATACLSVDDLQSKIKVLSFPTAKIFPVYHIEGRKYRGSRDLILNGTHIVRFNQGIKYATIQKICEENKCLPIEAIDKENNLYLVRYNGDDQLFLKTVNAFYEKYGGKEVLYAHPDFINSVHMETGVNDNPQFVFQQGALEQIGITKAWDHINNSGKPLSVIRVAILDEGIHIPHEDLGAGKVINRFDKIGGACPYNVDNGHGTAVAGIVGALNNDRYIVGVAYDTLLADIRISYRDSNGNRISSTTKAVKGLTDAINWNARVINISWSHPPVDSIADKIQAAIDKNIVVCCAAGNFTGTESQLVRFPASLAATKPVVAVAACNDLNTLINDGPDTGFGSCRGSEVTVAAPGIHIVTLSINGLNFITNFKGTSAAAAFVSGVAALLLAINPAQTPVIIRDLLKNTAITGTGQNVVSAISAVTNVVA